MDRQLAAAGRPATWPLERVLVSKVVLGLGGAGFGLLVFSGNPGVATGVVALATTLLGWSLPDILLYNQAIKRRDASSSPCPTCSTR
ncbi:MAG TPA: hypothetical protein VK038_08310 [Ornithinicoccus sp.]|nr:hypothetical protein [Ornithinicoccus sp.]